MMPNYAEKLHALGRLLDERIVRHVCLTEVPGGFVVVGERRFAERAGDVWQPFTLEVADSELAGHQPRRRGWPFSTH
jgi:hypothetical protein